MISKVEALQLYCWVDPSEEWLWQRKYCHQIILWSLAARSRFQCPVPFTLSCTVPVRIPTLTANRPWRYVQMALLSPIIGREPKSSIRRFLKVGFPGTAFSLFYGGAGSVHCLSYAQPLSELGRFSYLRMGLARINIVWLSCALHFQGFSCNAYIIDSWLHPCTLLFSFATVLCHN